MAKPIKHNPALQGKAAEQFREMFLTNSKPDTKKTEQHKKDIETYRATKVG